MSVYKNDNPEFLKLSIDSMINQTIKPNQFIIVKDGPLTIEIDKVLLDYKTKYPYIVVVESKNNVGLGKALDFGLGSCTNDLIARMDADDISLPNRCEELLKLFEKYPNLSLAGTNVDEFEDDPSVIISTRSVPNTYDEIVHFSKRRNPFNHPTVMFKKSQVIRCGGYGDLRRRQDYDLFCRMLNMGCYALNIDKSLLLFRVGEDYLKRRKSKETYRGTIAAAKLNYQRGYCSFIDYLYVKIGQSIIRFSPTWFTKRITAKILRK